jgi:hypothetical protein
MIFWNFKSPLTLFACIIWNTSEFFDIPLKNLAPIVFHMAMGMKKRKKMK